MAGPRGKVLVGQSGGPTCVINRSLQGIVEAAAASDAVTGILGMRHGIRGALEESFVDLAAVSETDLETVARTPCAALGSVRKKPTEEECNRILETCRKHDVRHFFYIGGNDTAETAHILHGMARDADWEMRLFHVPKTIDNDLRVTDHCPGYGSAARFVAMAFLGDNEDNRSLPGIKVDVVMGRHAGFLTAASILARRHPGDGPHLVYVPERDFDLERFVEDVRRVYEERGRCLIAVSEGIHGPDGAPVHTTGERDAHGNVQLSGTGALGDFLAERIRQAIPGKVRVRADTFGYLQRSFPGVVSETDAVEARRVGRAAVEAALAGTESGSIALRRTGSGKDYACETFVTELESVARKTKSLDPSFIKGTNDIDPSYLDYVAPLAGPLPETGRLEELTE